MEYTTNAVEKAAMVDYHRPPLTEEYWTHLQEAKAALFTGVTATELLSDPQIDPRILRSWLRSREGGVDPAGRVDQQRIHGEDYARVMDENMDLIHLVSPLLSVFEDQSVLDSGQICYLMDTAGICLFQSGSKLRLPISGLVINESTVGTCAHTLCMESKCPVQLFGPEQYSTSLAEIITTAVPIKDFNGRIVAVLVLSQSLMRQPWTVEARHVQSQIFAMMATLGMAVERQLAFNRSQIILQNHVEDLHCMNDILTETNDMLNTILSCVDEGVICIDPLGGIQHINSTGRRMLHLTGENAGDHNLLDFVRDKESFRQQIAEGRNLDVEERLCVEHGEKSYYLNLRPVRSAHLAKLKNVVVRLNPMEKMESLVASRAGSIAKYTFEDIMAQDENMRSVIGIAERFANSAENILLIGESGTGKELFAQAIHNKRRPNGPFIALNCASIPRELIESELFGYEGGSFTGAERAGRPGKIELANGGTLFLDEIGDMPLELQAVLLRTLEDHQVTRLGGRQAKPVNFCLTAATNKDLRKLTKHNLFREDLYFRLSVLHVNIPPLRERYDDIMLLARFFVESYCQKQKLCVPAISDEARQVLLDYDWPGNVRQLENAMIFAVNSAGQGKIGCENLPQYIVEDVGVTIPGVPAASEDSLRMDALERKAIEDALAVTKGNVPAAAMLLGMSRATLYRRLKKYQIPTT